MTVRPPNIGPEFASEWNAAREAMLADADQRTPQHVAEPQRVNVEELQKYVRAHGWNLILDHRREQGDRTLPSAREKRLFALGLDAGMAATLDYILNPH